MKTKLRPSIKWISKFGRCHASTTTTTQSQPAKEKPKLDFSWVSAASLSITVFAAVLFGAGKAYRQAYLQVFGFDDLLIPWSFQDLVYLGITKQLTILLTAPVIGMGAVLGLVFTLAISFWLLKVAQRRKFIETIAKKTSVERKFGDDIALDFALFLLNSLGAVLIVFMLALFFVARAEDRGKTDAKEHLAAIAERNLPNAAKPRLSFAIVERIVEKHRITEEGYVVTCSDRMCALFVPDKGSEASRLVTLEHLVSFRYVR